MQDSKCICQVCVREGSRGRSTEEFRPELELGRTRTSERLTEVRVREDPSLKYYRLYTSSHLILHYPPRVLIVADFRCHLFLYLIALSITAWLSQVPSGPTAKVTVELEPIKRCGRDDPRPLDSCSRQTLRKRRLSNHSVPAIRLIRNTSNANLGIPKNNQRLLCGECRTNRRVMPFSRWKSPPECFLCFIDIPFDHSLYLPFVRAMSTFATVLLHFPLLCSTVRLFGAV